MKNTFTETYKLLSAAYTGMGGFLDGAYLTRHPREAPDKFIQRQSHAYYLNYFAPCVNAHVDPVFKKAPNREWSGGAGELWKGFLTDADRAGGGIGGVMKRAAQGAKLYGVNFLVLDNVKQPAANLAATIAQRSYPYLIIVEPGRVQEIKTDQFGRLTLFSYLEPDTEDDSKQNLRTLTDKGWSLTGQYGGAPIEQGAYNLGLVPVVPLKAREADPRDLFPASEFISIARTNLAIYNMSSWLSDILINQTFSVLTYPSADKAGDLVLGTNNALAYDPTSHHQPDFIAPPADPANILAAQIARLQQECYRMATVVNVTGVRAEASGQAKAWDFECTNQILSGFADNVEKAETLLAGLFAAWVNMDLSYTVNYPSDFSISDIATELANAEIAKGMGFGDGFNTEVFKRVLASYLPELPADDFDKLVDEYKSDQTKQRQDREHDYNPSTGGL